MSVVVSAIVPAVAGLCILRRQVWGAYGFALFQLSQAATSPLLLLHTSSVSKIQIAIVVGFSLILALLFYSAGKSMAAAGARRGSLWPWVAFIFLFTLPLLFVRAFIVPTAAMEDTLLIGDRILARTFPPVKPGFRDIVIFRYPVDRRQTLIKRVIGLPGDRIKIVSKVVERNGAPLQESYVTHKFPTEDDYRDNFPRDNFPADVFGQPGTDPLARRAAEEMLEHHVSDGRVVVPPGKYFVLGDSRDNSLDSRYWGFVDESDMIGKPIFIYDSREGSRTRWQRVLKLP